MSTISLSSEDESDCFIVDPDQDIQPPHTVFILENKFSFKSLLKEDGEDQDLGGSCNPEFEKEPENILPEEFSEDEIRKEFVSCTIHNGNEKQDFYDEDTCELNNFEYDQVMKSVETSTKVNSKQDNNVIFERLAEALKKAISPSTAISPEELLNKEQGDTDLRSKENTNVDVKNATNNSAIFFKNVDLFKQTKANSQSCKGNLNGILGEATPVCVTTAIKNIEPTTEKTNEPNPNIKNISERNTSLGGETRGRNVGWRKSVEQNPCTKLISENNTTPSVKKRGRKLGWRKPVEQNPCTKLISENNTTPSVKKRGRKLGWRKPVDQNPCTKLISENNTTPSVKKRGRKLGWRKPVDQNPCTKLISENNTTPSVNKRGRKHGWRKPVDLNSASKLILKENTIVKKPGRKVGWRKSGNPNGSSNQTHIPNEFNGKEKSNELMKAIGTTDDDNRARESTKRTISKEPSSVVHNQCLQMEEESKDIKLLDEKDYNLQVSPRVSCDSMSPHSIPAIPYSAPNCNRLHTPEDISEENTVIESIEEEIKNKLRETVSHQNLQLKLTGKAEYDMVILKEDFVRCYNKIVNANVEYSITRLADMLLLTMREFKNCTERTSVAAKLTCKQLRDKEINMAHNSFKKFLHDYRTSFCLDFHKILQRILLNQEVVYQHRALLLAVFLKIFMRVSSVSPEHLDSIVLAKHSLTGLISNYMLTAPESIQRDLVGTFWQRDTDFERNCWFILDFFVTSLPKEIEHSSCYTSNKHTNLTSVSQSLSDSLQSQTRTSRKGAEVSVIVKNQYHLEKRCSSNVESNNSISLPVARQGHTHNMHAISNAPTVQYSSKDVNNGSVHNVTKSLSNTAEEMIEKVNINRFYSKEDTSYNRLSMEGYDMRVQITQPAKFINSPLDSQSMQKENTTDVNLGVKRKCQHYEVVSRKFPKTTDYLGSRSHLQQNTPTYTQAINAATLSYQQSHSAFQDSGVSRPLPSNYHSHGIPNRTTAPNSDQHVSSKEQTAEQVPSYHRAPPTHAHFAHSPNNALQQGQISSSTHRTLVDYANKKIEKYFLPVERNPYGNQRTSSNPHLDQRNETVHQEYNNIQQSNPAANVKHLSYHNQPPPPYCTSYMSSSANHQLLNRPYPNTSAAPYSRNIQYPNTYTLPYNFNPYQTDPRWRINSIAPENPLVNGTNTVTKSTYPSTLPGQMQRIRSHSGITVNNYNINTYVPNTMTEHIN